MAREKKKKPVKWVLRAKHQDDTIWEDIEEYTEEKKYADLRDTIDELKAEGYTEIRLDAVAEDGTTVKRCFYKRFGSRDSTKQFEKMQETMLTMMSQLSNMVSQMVSTSVEQAKTASSLASTHVQSVLQLANASAEAIRKALDLRQALEPPRYDYQTLLAELIDYERLKKLVMEVMGVRPEQSATSSTQMLQQILVPLFYYAIQQAAPGITELIKINPQNIFRETSTGIQTPTQINMSSLPQKTSPPRISDETRKMIEDINRQVAEMVLPPCMRGECVEGEAQGQEAKEVKVEAKTEAPTPKAEEVEVE